jgi:hypothetical protein
MYPKPERKLVLPDGAHDQLLVFLIASFFGEMCQKHGLNMDVATVGTNMVAINDPLDEIAHHKTTILRELEERDAFVARLIRWAYYPEMFV